MYTYILAFEVIIITRMHIFNPLGGRGPRGDRVLCKEYGCYLQDTFRLDGRAVTITS